MERFKRDDTPAADFIDRVETMAGHRIFGFICAVLAFFSIIGSKVAFVIENGYDIVYRPDFYVIFVVAFAGIFLVIHMESTKKREVSGYALVLAVFGMLLVSLCRIIPYDGRVELSLMSLFGCNCILTMLSYVLIVLGVFMKSDSGNIFDFSRVPLFFAVAIDVFFVVVWAINREDMYSGFGVRYYWSGLLENAAFLLLAVALLLAVSASCERERLNEIDDDRSIYGVSIEVIDRKNKVAELLAELCDNHENGDISDEDYEEARALIIDKL